MSEHIKQMDPTTRAYWDVTCQFCRARIGWCGTLGDRPPCPNPRCGRKADGKRWAETVESVVDVMNEPTEGYWAMLETLGAAGAETPSLCGWANPQTVQLRTPGMDAEQFGRLMTQAVRRGDVLEAKPRPGRSVCGFGGEPPRVKLTTSGWVELAWHKIELATAAGVDPARMTYPRKTPGMIVDGNDKARCILDEPSPPGVAFVTVTIVSTPPGQSRWIPGQKYTCPRTQFTPGR